MDRRAGRAFLVPSQYALPQQVELLFVRSVERGIALEHRIDLRPIFRQQRFGGDGK